MDSDFTHAGITMGFEFTDLHGNPLESHPMVAGQRSPKPDAALGAFMPGPVARMAAALELDAPRPAFLGGDGVVLFCDISGFTALTERLAREGMDGAEVLSRILESVFERIVGAIAVQGGEVVAFPGDAVIAVWSDPRPLEARVRAASAAALAIQALPTSPDRLAVLGRTGIDDLRVRVIAEGTFHIF